MVVVGLLVVNALLGAVRGFALQAFKLASIVLAIWLARLYADGFADLAAPHLDWPQGQRVALGWVVIGGAVFLVMVAIGHYAKNLIQRLRMGGADRALGTLLGALKGLLYAAVGMHILTAVISASSFVVPDHLKTTLNESRAFQHYVKAMWPVTEEWVKAARVRFEGPK